MKPSDLNSSEYHSYYGPYIKAMAEIELSMALDQGKIQMEQFLSDLPDHKLKYAYADGKWTVAQVLLHIIDAERVFQYRALRFARNDMTDLPGFDQDQYVTNSLANSKHKEQFAEAFSAVRLGSITLFGSFDDLMLKRLGTANGTQMSVRALGFVICGHQAHHLKVLRELYLV